MMLLRSVLQNKESDEPLFEQPLPSGAARRLGSITASALMFVVCGLSTGQTTGRPTAPEPQCGRLELPKIVETALKRFPDLGLSCRLSPPVIRGDFDGDDRPDYAVLVTQQSSQKRGFLLVFADGRTVVAGAGRRVEYGAAACRDLNFDQWELHPRSQPVESGDDQKPLKLHADALLVSCRESASGLFYWDGRGARWYQQGD